MKHLSKDNVRSIIMLVCFLAVVLFMVIMNTSCTPVPRYSMPQIEIMKADSGEIISEVKAPTDGIIFYAETRPVVYSNLLVFQIIKRIHL